MRRFVRMAIVASVGGAEFHRQVRSRNPQTVIVPRIDDHVGARRHMTRRAADRRLYGFMMAMSGGGVLVGRVTLQTDAVTGCSQFVAVRIVAIAAGDARREHPALLERAVIVDFVLHLPVGVVETMAELRNGMGVRQPLTGRPSFRELAAPRMAQPAGLDLLPQDGRCDIALWIAGRRIVAPVGISSLIEAHGETFGLVLMLAEWPPALLVVRPSNMARALAVAGFTADADLRPFRIETIARRIVILFHAGRMALGAHEIPVLVQLGPMQEIVVLDLLVRVEMEPALAALLFRPAVPCDR